MPAHKNAKNVEMGTPNMADIARICGVCRQTVSAVLNGKSWVSKKTRFKVMSVIEEQGFHPNKLATQLQRRSSNMVGVIIRDLTNPFYMQMIQGICDVTQPVGCHLLLADSHDRLEEEAESVATMLSYRVLGIIIAPIQVAETHSHLTVASKRPGFVSMGEIPGINCAHVDLDDELAGALAANYALDHGHMRFGYMAGPKTQIHSQLRLDGFLGTLEAHGITMDSTSIQYPGLSGEEQVSAAMNLLDREDRPSLVVCYNDLLAVSVYRAAHKLNLRIPDDVSVIGCDDIPVAELLGPALTTVAWPVREMGEMAAKKMLEQTNGEFSCGQDDPMGFAPAIVRRESVKHLK